MFLNIIILIIGLCLSALFASKASDAAADKGYNKLTWFHMCFWLGPIPYIIVAALPDITLHYQNNELIALQKAILYSLNSTSNTYSEKTAQSVENLLKELQPASRISFVKQSPTTNYAPPAAFSNLSDYYEYDDDSKPSPKPSKK